METITTNLIIPIEGKPRHWYEWILYACQHFFSMCVANSLIALIVFNGYDYNMVPAALISAGLGTLVYIFITRRRSPVFLGSSAALMSVMTSCLAMGGLAHGNFIALIIGLAIVGLIYCIVGIVIKYVGTSWLHRLLPPVVIGPVIVVIGLNLASFATTWSDYNSADAVLFNPYGLIVALFTMIIIAIVSHYSKKTFKTLPFLSGVIAGYVLSLIMTGLGYAINIDALKLIDFSVFNRIDWLPDFSIVYALDGATANGFTWSQIPAILLVSVPIAFVAMCEHIGDHMNLSGIVERDLLKDPGLTYTLIGDGVATALGGVVSGLGNTTYGENVAVIGLSHVASVRVVQVAALVAILFGFAAPIMLWVSSIPYAVFGGAALILYGFIAVSGLKQLKVVDLNDNRNIIIISVILIAGVGELFIQFGNFNFSGTALAMIIGVVLNLILKGGTK